MMREVKGCEKKATHVLIDGYGPDNYTYACNDHKDEMKSDTHIETRLFEGDAPCCWLDPSNDDPNARNEF